MFGENELIESVKNTYKNGDIEKCKTKLFMLILEINSKDEDYGHELKRILFQSDFVKNPMGRKYTKDDYQNLLDILYSVLYLAKAINDPQKDTSDLIRTEVSIKDGILCDLIDAIAYTECINSTNVVNTERMEKSKTFSQPFSKQLIALVMYYQDRRRLLSKCLPNMIKEYGITGMELSVSNRSVEFHEGLKGSYLDDNELILEGINQIILYLFYKNKDNMPEVFEDDIYTNPLLPYENVDFQKYLYIAFQRHLICSTEAGLRYGYYSIAKKKKDARGIDTYVFDFEDDAKSRARRIGVLRREYRIRSNMLIAPSNSEACMISSKYRPKLANELLNLQKTKGSLFSLEEFHPIKETFEKASSDAVIKMNMVKLMTDEYYLNSSVKDIKITDYLNAYCYLSTLGEIVNEAANTNIDENKQETYFGELALVGIEYLAEEFSRLYNYKTSDAFKLIDCFIFHANNNRGEDIFAEPLVQISKKQVIFSYALIEQVNLDRSIERLFLRFNKDVSKVGKDFEKRFLQTLSNGYSDLFKLIEGNHAANFSVNENHIVYKAFDGNEIEFDVVSRLDDYLILTELKAIMTSYDFDDLENRKRNIKKAIEQLHRRKESVQLDWDIFKEKVSIDLPDEPYDDEHIILVACTDAYDYTPLKMGDVYITDDSSYLKYFCNPYVESIIKDDKSTSINYDKVWKKDAPSAIEFMEYLENPITIHPWCDYLEKRFIPSPLIDKNDSEIYCADYLLLEDPIGSLMKKSDKKKKIYPNELCFCGSGKKYKYCCGSKKK